MSPVTQSPKSKPKINFGQPEKQSRLAIFMLWGFIVIAVGLVVWMVVAMPHQKELVCRHAGQTSLTGFGACSEE